MTARPCVEQARVVCSLTAAGSPVSLLAAAVRLVHESMAPLLYGDIHHGGPPTVTMLFLSRCAYSWPQRGRGWPHL
ncbi:hypothetical protein BU16DRAFT_118895 [Lophium mytilinum]|uniref:Uncharacterized protein n=1 Tax=Lophium mytilinum TaxID=390894 RepID=A0A6A6QHE3_9PEZI|nr:hypothetical protein BU16DRAFT_118895 [Lophium mytilinum]